MNILFQCVFGSHLYGTSLPTSDRDFKAVYMPSADDILLQRVRASINTNGGKAGKNAAGDVDMEAFSPQQFLRLAMEGQTVALDMLFAPRAMWLGSSPRWEAIVENRHRLIHRGVSAFVGYCRTQAGKYCLKADRLADMQRVIQFISRCAEGYAYDPRIKDIVQDDTFEGLAHVRFTEHPGANGENERFLVVCDREFNVTSTVGYVMTQLTRLEASYGARARAAASGEGADWKALLHAVRVAGEAEELLTTGTITFPRPDAELLLRIRQGLIPMPEVLELIADGL